jgi:hypothetical protein
VRVSHNSCRDSSGELWDKKNPSTTHGDILSSRSRSIRKSSLAGAISEDESTSGEEDGVAFSSSHPRGSRVPGLTEQVTRRPEFRQLVRSAHRNTPGRWNTFWIFSTLVRCTTGRHSVSRCSVCFVRRNVLHKLTALIGHLRWQQNFFCCDAINVSYGGL